MSALAGIDREGSRVPRATYRLQLTPGFTFARAAETARYLAELGVSDLYLSPPFRAGPDSTHGYDVCSYGELSPALGGEAGFEHLSRAAADLGMGLLMDMVPNHMGNDLSNSWWLDVLERGQDSPYATWFDIDWNRGWDHLTDKVLLPVLGDQYVRELEAGKLTVVFDRGHFAVAYHDRRFPASPQSVAGILREMAGGTSSREPPTPDSAGMSSREFPKCESLIDLAEELLRLRPQAKASDLHAIQRHLAKCHEDSEPVRSCVTAALERLNDPAGQTGPYENLHRFLQQQHYRLAFWRLGPQEINYRRFFDVTQLVSMRVQLPELFEASHQLVFRLVRERKVNGLRVDHPDGLWNPREYFARLREQALRLGQGAIYIVVEKILSRGEVLPDDWPVQGTTGYDFLNELNALFVESRNAARFQEVYQDFTGEQWDFTSLVLRSKGLILKGSLVSEFRALHRRLVQLARMCREGQDLSRTDLDLGLREMLAAFPVYRTYLEEQTATPGPAAAQYIGEAVRRIRESNPELNADVCRFIERLLLFCFPADMEAGTQALAREFVMRFQQLSGPLMAKGLEDTTFYRYFRLLSLNEVGGDPSRFGSGAEDFHRFNQRQQRHWPHTLLATATHDTKRGEDARARINVLSEMPGEWEKAVRSWSELNRAQNAAQAGSPVPDANDEYLFYQALVGAWTEGCREPGSLTGFRERLSAYMLKAIREAKRHTTWTETNEAYEQGMKEFVERVLARESGDFLQHFRQFHQAISFFGVLNSLAQLALKFTAPGVPDCYQGTELWDFSFVDPDNRRPVDYDLRRVLLGQIREEVAVDPDGWPLDPDRVARLANKWLEKPASGKIKLWLTWRMLKLRQRLPRLFEHGDYVPLPVSGAKQDHVCAFARTLMDQVVAVVVPRLNYRLLDGRQMYPCGLDVWEDTQLSLEKVPTPTAAWRSALTGERIQFSAAAAPVGTILSTLPFAVLVSC